MSKPICPHCAMEYNYGAAICYHCKKYINMRSWFRMNWPIFPIYGGIAIMIIAILTILC